MVAIVTALISAVAMVYAAKAEKNSRPVGNGFTGYVLDDLKELKQLLYDHVATHKHSDPIDE